jgi:hypothetical protein
MLVVVAPYPDFKGCFIVHANHDVSFIWAILIIWDARECESAIQ